MARQVAHDLFYLTRECAQQRPVFPELELAAEISGRYDAGVRRPMEDFVDPDEEEAWEAVRLAGEVATFVKSQLQPRGRRIGLDTKPHSQPAQLMTLPPSPAASAITAHPSSGMKRRPSPCASPRRLGLIYLDPCGMSDILMMGGRWVVVIIQREGFGYAQEE
ncbi:MAG: hypothetical protein OXI52_08740 [Caldilineaceae bacterium]|nr:hypothetical protein [Caldilineaceae bacterium]